MFKDNSDFYPTPKDLFLKLINDKRYINGKILEPSAGKGDMIKYIKELNRNVQIDAIENDDRLVNILHSNNINVVWNDFLTYQTYKEYDFIIMNPPFSNGVDHALNAIELAENQISRCEIYIILNKETIDNAYSNKRKELLQKLEQYDADIRYVENGFVDAERKTNVEVALISVVITEVDNGKSIYDKINFNVKNDKVNELETALSTHVKSNEIQAKLNDIERLVLEYETACNLAKKTYQANKDKSSFYSYIGQVNKKEGEISTPFSYVISNNVAPNDLNDELDRLRRGYWQLILDTDDFKKLLTNEALQKLNRQMEVANEMEINLTNIQMLLMALGANQEDILIDSIVSIFKRITEYHMNEYSSNIHYYNGWKTNNAYKINKKIIIPIKWEFEPLWDFKDEYERINMDVRHWIDDIVKAFQLIDSDVSDKFESINNQEFENDLLRFKMFLNGNIHVWFKDLELLNKLNYLCGSHFNWIPSTEEQKTDKKAREFVYKEFGNVDNVRLIAIT